MASSSRQRRVDRRAAERRGSPTPIQAVMAEMAAWMPQRWALMSYKQRRAEAAREISRRNKLSR